MDRELAGADFLMLIYQVLAAVGSQDYVLQELLGIDCRNLLFRKSLDT